MTDELAERRKKKELENSPHTTGEAICLGCKHTWIAAVPIRYGAEEDMECPSCGALRGVWRHNFGPGQGNKFYECNHCKSSYFMVLPDSVMCIGCGCRTTYATLAELQ